MMKGVRGTESASELPEGWSIHTKEVSAGVFEFRAASEDGRAVSHTGDNPELLIERCIADAVAIQSRHQF